jgi:hypothetical protein
VISDKTGVIHEMCVHEMNNTVVSANKMLTINFNTDYTRIANFLISGTVIFPRAGFHLSLILI